MDGRRLLIVVDYQKDFVDGALGFPGAESLEAPICRKIAEYKSSGGEVVYTMDTHDGMYLDTMEGKILPVPHTVLGTPGWELYGRVKQELEGCREFQKPTFPSGDLYEYLKGKAYESVELVGLVSNMCVISNAVIVKAALPYAEILVDRNCTASFDPELHEKALDVMAGFHVRITGGEQ